jgi:HEAT repeat protein
LDKPNPEYLAVQVTAVRALGKIGSELAVAELIAMQNNTDSSWHGVATSVLENYGVEGWNSRLTASDPSIRRFAAEYISEHGSDADVPLLIEALSDNEPSVRQAAATALGDMEAEAAILPLIEAMGDRDDNVREAVAKALSQFKTYTIVPLLTDTSISMLTEAIGDENPDVRWVAISILDEANAINVQTLVDAVQPSLFTSHDLDEVAYRRLMIGLLQEKEDMIVTERLVGVLNFDKERPANYYAAITALGRRHHQQNLADSDELLQTLADVALRPNTNFFARYGAVVLLSSLGTDESIRLLADHEAVFVELVEENSQTPPFSLPCPLTPSSASELAEEECTVEEGETLFATLPSSLASDVGFWEDIATPAKPTQGETLAQLEGRGPLRVCRFAWFARHWSRCR